MPKGLNRKNRRGKGVNAPSQPTIPKMSQKHFLEKRVKRYIMASVDTGQYLVVIPGKHQYVFTKNIIQATKCRTPFDAKTVIRDYRIDTGDVEFDLVVIPLQITYELINETISSSIKDSDYLEDLCLMDDIKLILDEELISKYSDYYFEKHPKAKKKPIDKPWHPSVNEWMIMKRPQMNMLKQKWKEFGVWWVNELGYQNKQLNRFEIDMRIFFDTKRRHDPDNYVAKFLYDGFTESGFLMDDDGEHLKSLTIHTDYDRDYPRTEIIVRRIKE